MCSPFGMEQGKPKSMRVCVTESFIKTDQASVHLDPAKPGLK